MRSKIQRWRIGLVLVWYLVLALAPMTYAAPVWVGEQVDEIAGAGDVFTVQVGDADNEGLNEVLASTRSGLILLYKYSGGAWVRQTIQSTSKKAFILFYQ